ncbi:MAG: isocitrate lyase/phosphoenolpyruvate mutase family protein [Actinomycetia bacterium]|nr:isocitrate lyase/phosphoenolpyruvate mutase family protein [Actinomycetes bacterium]
MNSPQSTRFHELHASGFFLIPNPWDVGSARLLESLGFPALATTSSGFAATLGRNDQEVSVGELIEHVAAVCAAVEVPVNVDFEWGYATEPEGLGPIIARLAEAGAAGFSLEDFDPAAGDVVSIDQAAERVEAGAAAAAATGMLFTARTENHLYGHDDLDDTIARLERFAAAGADALYAPGAGSAEAIARIVAVGCPVNVLALPGVPPVAELVELGVRRVSTGGALAWVAYGALVDAARELLDDASVAYLGRMLSGRDRAAAFDT